MKYSLQFLLSFLFLISLFLTGCGHQKEQSVFKTLQEKSDVSFEVDELKPLFDLISSKKYTIALSEIGRMYDSYKVRDEFYKLISLRALTYFYLNQFELSFRDINQALEHKDLDESFVQILYSLQLRIKVSEGKYKDALGILNKISPGSLPKNLFYEYYFSIFKLYSSTGEPEKALESLVTYLSKYQTINSLQSSEFHDALITLFNSLDEVEKIEFIKSHKSPPTIPVGYLTYYEAKKISMKMGGKADNIYLSTLKYDFSSFLDLMALTNNLLKSREINIPKNNKIGVVLPLTGPKSKFGKIALEGILFGFKNLVEQDFSSNIKFVIKDSSSNDVKGKHIVKDLIVKENVDVIIGGLFPKEAELEYLEAKKFGKIFISLANVLLSRTHKDHHLFEIEDSIESQIELLKEDRIRNEFGYRIAILHPNDSRGMISLNELWNNNKVFEIKAIQEYQKKSQDYRSVVQKVLSLAYVRERKEELEILKEIYELDKRGIRRVQILTPVIDFDWVYMPGLPQEVMRLIPTFNYFDAKGIRFIGGPSWTGSHLKKSLRGNKVYSIRSDNWKLKKRISELDKDSRLSLIHYRAIEALLIATRLNHHKFNTQTNLNQHIKDKKEINVVDYKWLLKNNLWHKNNLTLKKL